MVPPRRTLRAPSPTRLKLIGKMQRAPLAHIAPGQLDGVKTCKIQCADKPLRPKGAGERQFALSRRHSQALVCQTEPLAARLQLHRGSGNASAAPAERSVPSLWGCGGMEHRRWKGRWQAIE